MKAIILALCAIIFTQGSAAPGGSPVPLSPPDTIAVDIAVSLDGIAVVRFDAAQPVTALHFPQALGDYRTVHWQTDQLEWRWVNEGDGERIERTDQRPFRSVTFRIPIRYQVLPKAYAPFSPFSDGGLLVYSGQFNACGTAECAEPISLDMTIAAPGRTIRAPGITAPDVMRYRSVGDGANIYIGTALPIRASGLDAILDPLLTGSARSTLEGSLPASISYFAQHYGPLTFTPMLFISVDSRPRSNGNESTQGGTLPGQIFMHFDGARASQRVATGSPTWLQWFFAHEVAHLFQGDNTENRSGDDIAAWMHEGGADAMAAVALIEQGQQAYVRERLLHAASECDAALAIGPLTTATSRDAFDAHYSCGLVATLALDQALHDRKSNLHAFNSRLFAAVAAGAPWSEASWFDTARQQGVAADSLRILRIMVGADSTAARAALVDATRMAVMRVGTP